VLKKGGEAIDARQGCGASVDHDHAYKPAHDPFDISTKGGVFVAYINTYDTAHIAGRRRLRGIAGGTI